MISGNTRIAINSIRSAKWRSFLTSLGIIIGVMSVITVVSLGEGVKQQLTGQINRLGSDLITVRPGQIITKDSHGRINGLNFFSGLGASTLTEQDIEQIQKIPGVKVVTPLSTVTGVAQTSDRQFGSGQIIATTPNLQEALKSNVQYGGFFTDGEDGRHVAIIGKTVAEKLFQESIPVGMSMNIRGQDFVVRGVFDELDNNPLNPGLNLNSAIFIPYGTGKSLGGGNPTPFQILIRPVNKKDTRPIANEIHERLRSAHGGQEDFTVLTQQDNLQAAGGVINLLTAMISAIAAISLLVGGIGIMNIMLVSVSERTQEIGVRKAVGATNRQILSQFLIEASILSLAGGFTGVLLSFAVNFGLRVLTNLKPAISLPVMAAALGVSVLVGIIFGLAPALQAARKDPIAALRRL